MIVFFALAAIDLREQIQASNRFLGCSNQLMKKRDARWKSPVLMGTRQRQPAASTGALPADRVR